MHTARFAGFIYLKRRLRYDFLIDAIVTSFDKDNLLVTPNGEVDFSSLVGKQVKYIDSSSKIWKGIVVAVEEPYATVKFNDFPTGLGQGQIVQILEENESEVLE